ARSEISYGITRADRALHETKHSTRGWMFAGTERHRGIDYDGSRRIELCSTPRRRDDKASNVVCVDTRTPLAPVHRGHDCCRDDGGRVGVMHRRDDARDVEVRRKMRDERVTVFVNAL